MSNVSNTVHVCLRTVLSLAMVAAPLPAISGPNDALVVFDGFCIGSGADPRVVEKMARGAGGVEVSQQSLDQDPAIARHGGKGYALQRNELRFIVLVSNVRTCSILALGEAEPSVRRVLEKNFPLSAPFIDLAGTQVTRLYRVLDPSPLSGSYIMLMSPKKGFSPNEFVSIGFIPAAVAKENGIGK